MFNIVEEVMEYLKIDNESLLKMAAEWNNTNQDAAWEKYKDNIDDFYTKGHDKNNLCANAICSTQVVLPDNLGVVNKHLSICQNDISVLDFGCGCGALLLTVFHDNKNALLHFVDNSEYNLWFVANEITKYNLNGAAISGSKYIDLIVNWTVHGQMKDRYDLIVCTDVLEHIQYPFAAIELFTTMLKEKGKLLLTICELPGRWHLQSSIDEYKTKCRPFIDKNYTHLEGNLYEVKK